MNSSAIATLSIAVMVTSIYGCATVGPMSKQELNAAYSDKTAYYQSGEKELTKSDGTAIYDSKKWLQIGKWWPEHGKIYFKYEGDRKTHCTEAKKKGEEIFYKKSISFKSGDPDNLEQKYNAKVEKDKAEEEKKRIEKERVAKEKEAERQRVAA